jgi:hypothetical protein
VTQPAAPTTPTDARPSSLPSFSAVPGCIDCRKLTGDEPLTAGAELTLRYAGFQPAEEITLVMRSTPVELGTFSADAAGVLTAEVTIPAAAEAGSHTLTLTGPVTGDHVVRFRLTAAEQATGTAAATAASEGTDLALPLALGAAGVLLFAVGGLVLHRRRATQLAATDQSGNSDQRRPAEGPSSRV